MEELFKDNKYIRFVDILEKASKASINMLVSYPSMNVADRNFFETVAMLPEFYDDDYIDIEWVKKARTDVRNEVLKIREKVNE